MTVQADIESSMVAAAPFVGADSRVIELPEEVDVCYRLIEPGDAHALQRFHGRLSQRSVYLRFFLAKPARTGSSSWDTCRHREGHQYSHGDPSPENATMLNQLRDLGLPDRLRYEGDVEYVDIDLSPSEVVPDHPAGTSSGPLG
ncbi:MAG TPA: hypothetical protein VHM69_11580 [Rubrobacter sp.]|nr:hypothetical protein [Rubrobacter sp.]